MAIVEPDARRVLDQAIGRTLSLRGPGDVERDDPATLKVAQRHRLRRLVVADILGLCAAAVIGPMLGWALADEQIGAAARSGRVILVDLAAIPVFIAMFALYGSYRGVVRRISISVLSDLRHIWHALLVGGVLFAAAVYAARGRADFAAMNIGTVIAMCLVAAVTVPAARMVVSVTSRGASAGSVPVIVVGTGKLAQTVASHLRAHSSVNFVGFVDDNPLGRKDVLGELDELPELCRRYSVARVVVCFSRTHPERTTRMLKSLAGQVGVSIVPRYYELITARTNVEDLSGLPMLDIAPSSLSLGSRFLKRTFDVVVSSAVLLVCAPFFAAVAITIKATSEGSVFFRQTRTGRDEESFSMMKFRTMYRDAEARRHEVAHLNEMDGPLFKIQNDPRVTRVGRLLRKTSLDELPQLINVWKGDMSLVGPRPFVVDEAAEIEGWARKRFEVRPGMTGLWQVSGRNELSHLELCRLDYLYVASWSFGWDLQILWQTPATIFGGRGAS
jgi:exopolysaccharide biosynthesis polyprenyl glycosylphosphotransferase